MVTSWLLLKIPMMFLVETTEKTRCLNAVSFKFPRASASN